MTGVQTCALPISLPKSDEYVNQIDILRYGNIAGLTDLTNKVSSYIDRNNLQLQELSDIRDMLLKIKLPLDEAELYPYEIPIIIEFRKLLYTIEEKIDSLSN